MSSGDNDPHDGGEGRGPANGDAPQPPQGSGWLGTVRSWIGGSEGEKSEAGERPTAAGAAAGTVTLSADEVRRRRLEKMEGTVSQQVPHQQRRISPPSTAATAPGKTPPKPSTSPEPKAAGQPSKPSPPAAPASAAASAGPVSPPPAKANTVSKPSSTAALPSSASGGGNNPVGVDVDSAVAGRGDKAGVPGAGSAAVDGRAKISVEQRTHNALRTVLRVTLSRGEKSAEGFVYVGEVVDDGKLMSEENVPELICARLAAPETKERGIGYLAGAFARCHEELQSVRRRAGKAGLELTIKALESTRSQLVNYSATCLMEPGIFEEPEADSPAQLVKRLTATELEVPAGFLSLVLAELDAQGGLEEVIGSLVTDLTAKLDGCKTLSDPWHGPFQALSAFLSFKRACEAVLKTEGFALPKAGTPAAAPIPAPMPTGLSLQMLLQGGSLQQRTISPRSGPMAADRTLLGRVLRLGCPVTDQQVNDSFDKVYRRGRLEVNNRLKAAQERLKTSQLVSASIVMHLVKASPQCRKAVMSWFADTLLLNTPIEATNPDPLKAASHEFLMNVSVALLGLAMPIVRDEAKFNKVDAASFFSSKTAIHDLFPEDTTKLVTKESTSNQGGGEAGDSSVPFVELKSFTTQAFFACWRALHLGLFQVMSRHDNLHRHLGHVQQVMGFPGASNPDPRIELQFNMLFKRKMAAEIAILEPGVLSDSLLFMIKAGTWLTEFVSKEAGVAVGSFEDESGAGELQALPQDALVWRLPEHLLQDILNLVLFLTQYHPATLGTTQLYPLMTTMVFFLSHPSLVRSPHLRASLGDVLYKAFLPRTERSLGEDSYGAVLGDDANTGLLYAHPLAQQHLAPSLLLLYGDVEHTGYEDKLSHRIFIAIVLKYLWKNNNHRSTFRRIAQDTRKFVRFANGLMNESNSLVSSVMERLPQVRATQLQMRDSAQWGALTENQRNEITQRYEENERALKSNLSLCNETLHMVTYLTSDKDIQKTFLRDELAPRLAEMLLCVLKQLIGSKGLEIKVDNPESYNFRPKEMLREICATISHFANESSFHKYLAMSGYYDQDLLPKALSTMRRLQLLPAPALSDIDRLCSAVVESRASYEASEASLGEIPDEFLDPVLFQLMRDPVLLPTSGIILDRPTIVQHLLNDSTDPFNRQPLTEGMLQPQSDLRERIEEFVKRRQAEAGPPST